MNPVQQAKADYLRGVGYYDTDAGWTHKDLDGECYTLEAAYEYEIQGFFEAQPKWNTRAASPSLPVPEDDVKFAERMRGYVKGMTDNNTATALELAEAMQVIANLLKSGSRAVDALKDATFKLNGYQACPMFDGPRADLEQALTTARALIEGAAAPEGA